MKLFLSDKDAEDKRKKARLDVIKAKMNLKDHKTSIKNKPLYNKKKGRS